MGSCASCVIIVAVEVVKRIVTALAHHSEKLFAVDHPCHRHRDASQHGPAWSEISHCNGNGTFGRRSPPNRCMRGQEETCNAGRPTIDTHTHTHTHTHTPSLSRSASSIISVSSSSESFSPSSCACDKQRTHGDEPMHGCAAKATQAQPNLARGRAEECQAGELEKSLEEILGIASAGANYALLSSDSGM